MKNSIQIERKNLGKKGTYATAIMFGLISLLGFFSVFWDWKSSIAPVVCVIVTYFLNRRIMILEHLKWFFFGLILVGLLLSWGIQLSFWVFILQFLALTCFLGVISSVNTIRDDRRDIIFSMNADHFSCLCPGNNDYKGYALNPMGYKKYFMTKDIDSIQQDRSGLLIVVKGEILRPRELRASEIAQILAYFNAKDIELIAAIPSPHIYREERELAWVKILVFGIPCALGGLSIYFLGNNGRNIVVSAISILLTILLVLLLLKLVNIWKRGSLNK
ncbi:hypothetical protein [Sphingobacterium sp. HMA12]|uniref:hypothetical protein n=1 Tax=Sphingobacterium sp. HMA12 TaxID=2050894 RepID=UPI001315A013|nr:hypothetical protein [Sphingobacterium sp. HMA12]